MTTADTSNNETLLSLMLSIRGWDLLDPVFSNCFLATTNQRKYRRNGGIIIKYNYLAAYILLHYPKQRHIEMLDTECNLLQHFSYELPEDELPFIVNYQYSLHIITFSTSHKVVKLYKLDIFERKLTYLSIFHKRNRKNLQILSCSKSESEELFKVDKPFDSLDFDLNSHILNIYHEDKAIF